MKKAIFCIKLTMLTPHSSLLLKLVFPERKASKMRFRRHDCDCSFAAWLLRCRNTVNTSFKLNWGTTWRRPCVSTALWISAGPGVDSQACFSLLGHSLYWCCFAGSLLERQPLLHMCRWDQIPTVLFFCSVTHWSVRLYSPAHASTCFPSARPSPGSSLFDLHFSHLPLSHRPPLALLLASPEMKPPTPPLPFCYILFSICFGL